MSCAADVKTRPAFFRRFNRAHKSVSANQCRLDIDVYTLIPGSNCVLNVESIQSCALAIQCKIPAAMAMAATADVFAMLSEQWLPLLRRSRLSLPRRSRRCMEYQKLEAIGARLNDTLGTLRVEGKKNANYD